VYQQNLQADFNPNLLKINIQGFLVGNACTNWRYDSFQALIETVVGFDMAHQELLDTWNENECA